jgi:hypothetical protein
VDVDSEAWIAGRNVARDRDLGWASTSPTGYPNLGAGNVELRRAGDVETNMFDPEQVLWTPR